MLPVAGPSREGNGEPMPPPPELTGLVERFRRNLDDYRAEQEKSPRGRESTGASWANPGSDLRRRRLMSQADALTGRCLRRMMDAAEVGRRCEYGAAVVPTSREDDPKMM